MNRRQSLRLLAGALASCSLLTRTSYAAEPSFREIHGTVKVNGQAADTATVLKAGDKIESAADGSATFVTGGDAFALRPNTLIELGQQKDVGTCRIERGALLVAIGKNRILLTASGSFDMSEGACYLEVDARQTYFCLCYGDGVLRATAGGGRTDSFLSEHHDRAVFVSPKGEDYIVTTQVKGHTDEDIVALDKLLGRTHEFTIRAPARPKDGQQEF